MTQFSSTLYPQTSPTNVILLELRSIYLEDHKPFGIKLGALAEDWLDLIRHDPAMVRRSNWGALVDLVTGNQIDHAHRVLTRLVSLSG